MKEKIENLYSAELEKKRPTPNQPDFLKPVAPSLAPDQPKISRGHLEKLLSKASEVLEESEIGKKRLVKKIEAPVNEKIQTVEPVKELMTLEEKHAKSTSDFSRLQKLVSQLKRKIFDWDGFQRKIPRAWVTWAENRLQGEDPDENLRMFCNEILEELENKEDEWTAADLNVVQMLVFYVQGCRGTLLSFYKK